MRVEIIVPVINLWEKYTKPAIDSIMDAMIRAKVRNIDCHVLLIDNASTDETITEAPKLESELFHYHKNTQRWGLQKSINFGVTIGYANKADLFFVCNNDIVLHSEAIWRLVERFDKGDVAMVTAQPIDGEMREKHLIPSMISTINVKERESIEESPHPCFSAFMLNRACWEVVGEFDELFAPAYFEDNDYHYRMQLAELPAILLPTAVYYHYGSTTQHFAQENGRVMVNSFMFENNKAAFIKKWGGMPKEEKFYHPYDNSERTIRATKQSPNL